MGWLLYGYEKMKIRDPILDINFRIGSLVGGDGVVEWVGRGIRAIIDVRLSRNEC